jgi:predicted glycosyltransferase
MRIWVDCTNSPHVLIFRPLIRRMQERGHEVVVTSRDFAQTIPLLDKYGIPHQTMGAHGGGGLRGKARAMTSRSSQLWSMVRREHFDLAVAHGSTDQPLVARLNRIPQVTMFDYEFAAAMHHSNGRLASRVLVPDAIPAHALKRYGIRPPKLIRYPGLKEEYYLADDAPDPGVAAELGLDTSKVIVVLRPPPEVTLYHRGASTDLFARVVDHLESHADGIQVVALPRIEEQRAALRRRGVIVPEVAVDGPGLINASDLVISAGGTMNREAVALGVPAYSPFAGRLGAVDARLIAEGRLHRLEDPADLALVRRERSATPPMRDPDLLVDLILGAAETGGSGRRRRSRTMDT